MDKMTPRQQLKEFGFTGKKLSELFGYKQPKDFYSSSARTRIELGVLRVIEEFKQTKS